VKARKKRLEAGQIRSTNPRFDEDRSRNPEFQAFKNKTPCGRCELENCCSVSVAGMGEQHACLGFLFAGVFILAFCCGMR